MHIEEWKTDRNVWKKLRGIFAEPSTVNRIRLCERPLTLQLLDGYEAYTMYRK